MKLYDIISNMKFIGIKYYKDLDIDSLTADSKQKCNNGMYFCIKGMRYDGHDFAAESVTNGAICLVVERFLDVPITQIMVENVRYAMSYIAQTFYGTYKTKMKFIGITGTNGKTTTTFMLREILTNLGHRVGLIGTEGIYIGNMMLPPMLTTPDPIVLHKLIREMADNGCEYCIMEVSAHAIALNKIDCIMFDAVALTNITKDHLDFFITMENYIKCKYSLFSPRHAKAGIVNVDGANCKDLAKKCDIPLKTIGYESDFKILHIAHTITGSQLKFEYKQKSYTCKTNLMGDYNVYNTLTAIACLVQVGINLADILAVLKTKEIFVPGRFNVLKLDCDFSVMIDYAHTPDGIKNVLSTLKQLPIKNLITVFGCGGNRDKTKRAEMGQIASKNSDYVIVTSDNPRDENPEFIIDDIVKENDAKNMVRITDRRSAIEYALAIAKPNDMVAILGKGAETYQEIKGVKYPFSDYDCVDGYFKYSFKDKIKL